jgi:hypothetical protein
MLAQTQSSQSAAAAAAAAYRAAGGGTALIVLAAAEVGGDRPGRPCAQGAAGRMRPGPRAESGSGFATGGPRVVREAKPGATVA